MDPEEISEIEPHSGMKKRGRKPNSLMNPEEGYENYWMQSGKKSPKSAEIRKSNEKESDSLPAEDLLRVKVSMTSNSPSMLEEATEPSTFPATHQKTSESPNSQPKPEGDIVSACSLLQNGHPHGSGSESRRGRPKKQVAVAHQAVDPTSLSPAKGDFSSAHAEEKRPGSFDILKTEFKETSALKTKSRGRPRKFPAKTNDETVICSVHVGTEKESAVPSDPEEKQQESALTLGTGNINDQSTVEKVGTGNVTQTKPRGRPRKLAAKINQETVLASDSVAVTESPVPIGPEQTLQEEPALQSRTGSIKNRSARKGIQKLGQDQPPGKDSAEGSLSKKISKSETKMEGEKNFVEGAPKIRKRKNSIAKQEANPMPDPDDRIVGKGIKVWWPADRTFYDGVVRSYDSVRKKHLVIYNDGEKENLNLQKQRWELIGDDSIDPCLQLGEKKDTPKTDASDSPQKRKRTEKSGSCTQENADFSLERTGAAGLSTVECMKSDSISADCSTLSEPIKDKLRDDKSKEIDRLTDNEGEIHAGMLKADMKTGVDSTQIIPEAVILSKEESPKVDIESSVSVGAKEMTELSNGTKDASSSPPSPLLDKVV